jgi:small subunit ribosomal protein S9
MADEPEQPQEQPEEPQQPAEEEQPSGEAAEPAEEPAPEAEQPAEEQPAEEQPAEAEQPVEAEASPQPASAEPAAEEAAPEQPQADGAEEKPAEKPKDLPPGAELDPIALEPDRPLSAEEKARLEAEAEEKAQLEAAAASDAPDEAGASEARTPAQLAGDARYFATGKRKRSIARVIITPGEGKFEINRRTLKEYFPRPLHQSTALQPLSVCGYEGTVDVRVNVQGGGIGGQAGAVRHGIARALTEIDPELRKELKRRGFLTRDARVKERRKAGLKKARKRPQFSKR